jgi:FeS assembly SUF system regulator
MIRLTNLADYAVVVMTTAAKWHDRRFSAPELAAVTAIPAPTVAKLLGTLARAGLLVASRGASGGFQLVRAAGEITVAEIIEAVDGPITLTQCASGQHSECTIEGSCGVRAHWIPINHAVRDALVAVTLADLVQPASTRVAVPAETSELVA